jgi:hypothetical protein
MLLSLSLIETATGQPADRTWCRLSAMVARVSRVSCAVAEVVNRGDTVKDGRRKRSWFASGVGVGRLLFGIVRGKISEDVLRQPLSTLYQFFDLCLCGIGILLVCTQIA